MSSQEQSEAYVLDICISDSSKGVFRASTTNFGTHNHALSIVD